LNKKVYIRVDASPEIGLGHVVRCIALAQMISNDFEIIFVTQNLPEKIQQNIFELNFKLISITEENEITSILSTNDIVVIDHYGLGIDYHRLLKQQRVKIVCIDDIHEKEFDADLIINHAPSVSSDSYKSNHSTVYALGLYYALLRPIFFQQKTEYTKEKNSLLICFGGSDFKNLTLNVLTEVLKGNSFEQITVVTGSAYLYIDELNPLLTSDNRVTHYHAVNDLKIFELLSKSEASITPASGILFEAIACNCIAISGYYVENQTLIYKGFLELNAIVDAKDFSNLALQESFLRAQTFSNNVWIDGKSPERILTLFKNL
jgi:UDP-2,4-diacetamido-2,4,6-trideoxy-beta-L-altropyranose hydrolase